MKAMDQKCVLVRKEEINKTLASAPVQGKKLLEPLKSLAAANKLPFNILEDTEVLNNEAEIHKHEGDLWLCLEGEPTFVYGGELVEPWVKKNADGTTDEREWKAKEIRGGTKAVLKPGDWLWIPAGQPHQHLCSDTARLAIIKIPKKYQVV
jgi:mannose-6-phosphate isomerase-like protein (cupin superfamily)